ncbi:MAG: FtsW/RodA/SpoVE family cell cycle protein [bacterium]|nr:FtsW/RodA/SpoVE family cell cycle protein [bacterium]
MPLTKHFFLPVLIICLSIIGLFIIYSIKPGLFPAQLIAFLAGLIIISLLPLLPFPIIINFAPFFYLFSLVLLLLTLFSPNIRGAHRWLFLGPLHLQPSEIIKLSLTLLSWWLVVKFPLARLKNLKSLALIASVFSLPLVLILFQPDLGTFLFIAFVIILAWLPVFITPKRLIFLSLILISFAPFTWYQLKPYQKQRLVTFLDPFSDPQRAGYNIIKARLAIQNGRIFGSLNQPALYQHSLPESHTDFIFAVWVEDTGLIGGLALIALYLYLLFAIYKTKKHLKPFETAPLIMIIGFVVLQAFFHIGINLGILPVTGLPLPFISYGRSSLLTSFALVGLLMARLNRPYHFSHTSRSRPKLSPTPTRPLLKQA